MRPHLSLAFLAGCLLPMVAAAQESPFFVTYSHHMEEPGSLEVETKSAAAHPVGGNLFLADATELEYGTTAWWTSELYLDWQHTRAEGSLFNGFRIENRIRPFFRELPVNPVLYVEFEDINGADKNLLEVVGHDVQADLATPNDEARTEKQRELELKLILSGDFHGWTLAENTIAEKNLAHAPWEFGYAVGVSRPLRVKATARECRFCAENFQLGAEMYGGLGDVQSLGLHDTSQYAAADLNWSIAPGVVASVAPSFGLNGNSLDHLVRLGVSYEVGQLTRLLPTKERRRP